MLPLEMKIAYAVFVAVLVPVYFRQYGPGNFLWFSDVALLVGGVALWLEQPLLASTQAIAVLVPELFWTADFVLRLMRRRGLGDGTLTQYMFDRSIPLTIRALSLFHLWLPPVLLWMVYRMGYDRRAFVVQSICGALLVVVSRLLTDPRENVNWSHQWPGLGGVWPVALGMVVPPLVFYLPAHLLLSALVPTLPVSR